MCGSGKHTKHDLEVLLSVSWLRFHARPSFSALYQNPENEVMNIRLERNLEFSEVLSNADYVWAGLMKICVDPIPADYHQH